ncbi:hypothetical protein EVA_21823, partial [gut metagenome]
GAYNKGDCKRYVEERIKTRDLHPKVDCTSRKVL